jgi:uncharacterized membrane protein YgcG
MSTLTRVLFLLFAVMASVAFAQISPLPNQYGPVVKWRTIAIGDNSKIDHDEAWMVSGDDEWEAYYRKMIGAKADEKVRVPQIADWRKEDVLIIHIGTRATAGYAVYVETIGRSAQNYYDVHFVLQEPPKGSQIREGETSPFVVIAIEKTTGTPRYYSRVSTQATYFLPGGCTCGNRPVIMVGAGGRVTTLNDGKCPVCGGKLPVYGPGPIRGSTGGGTGGGTGGNSGGNGRTGGSGSGGGSGRGG